MELFAQQVLNGLVTGSIYSLVALGLTLIYGTMQVPNFAHGQLFMLGAYIAYASTRAGLDYWSAMVIAVAVVALAGIALERLVFRPLRNAPHLNSMIAALGLMLFLEAVAQNIWGEEFRHMDAPYGGVVSVLGLLVTTHRLILVGAAAVLTPIMSALLYGVGPTDPITYGAVAMAIGAVTLLATYLPARRASRVQPVVALRSQI